MQLPDVNLLLYAHRQEYPDHEAYARWLTALASGPEPFALSELVLSGFLRIATHRRIFKDPTPLPVALAFCRALRERPTCRIVRPGPRHWDIFTDLAERSQARGALIADAWHAALVIEQGCEWLTNDADFARFPGLRWRHPLAG